MRYALMVLSLVAAAALQAQQRQASSTSSCQIEVDRAPRFKRETVGGLQRAYGGGGVRLFCANQPSTTITSDSFNYHQGTNSTEFIGRVQFRDSTGLLDADKATYWNRLERLYAEGNVYTKNFATGTELRGPNLDFFRVSPGIRDTQELTATRRPTINFVPSGANADTANPFVLVADRVYMKHTDRMWGSGRVVIDRLDLNATADSAALQLSDSVGHLIGAPVVRGYDTTRVGIRPPRIRIDTVRTGRRIRIDTVRVDTAMTKPDSAVTYTLLGQRIQFDLTSGQRIKRVLSMGDADARGPQWHLVSDTLDMAIDSGEIQRAQAWGNERRAVAVSGLSTITADSLDIQMPGQVMRQVWAYRQARATSKADSTWVEDDWMSGDSLLATFAPVNRDSVADSTGRRASEIERVTAFGTARAFYHTDNQRDPNGERGINYSRGDRIRIAMREGKVRTVDIVGTVDGVFLEPVTPGSDSTSDSTAVDSTGRRPAGRATPPSAAPTAAPSPPAPQPPPVPLPARPSAGTPPRTRE